MKTGIVYPTKESEQTASAISKSGTKLQFTAPKGSYDGTVKVASTDANFVTASIVDGKSIFGLAGSAEEINTDWKMGFPKYKCSLIYGSDDCEVIIKDSQISRDGGATFYDLPFTITGYWDLVTSGNGKYIYVAITGTTNLMVSSNYGVTWTTVTLPDTYTTYRTNLVCTSSGNKVFVPCDSGTKAYISTDYGLTFSISTYVSFGEHNLVCGNPTCTTLYKGTRGSSPMIYGSIDSGANWTSTGIDQGVLDMKCDSSGICYCSTNYNYTHKLDGISTNTSTSYISALNDYKCFIPNMNIIFGTSTDSPYDNKLFKMDSSHDKTVDTTYDGLIDTTMNNVRLMTHPQSSIYGLEQVYDKGLFLFGNKDIPLLRLS